MPRHGMNNKGHPGVIQLTLSSDCWVGKEAEAQSRFVARLMVRHSLGLIVLGLDVRKPEQRFAEIGQLELQNFNETC